MTSIDRPLRDGRLSVFFLVITIGLTLGLAGFLARRSIDVDQPYIIPLILLVIPLLSVSLQKRSWTEAGFTLRGIGSSLRLLSITCLVIFPFVIIAMSFMRRGDLPIPLRPEVPAGKWPRWLLYQFFYAAIPEEFFFRGYLMSSWLRIWSKAGRWSKRKAEMTAVLLSALLFSLGHLIVGCGGLSVLIFFPGLVLGWLFIRTRSLLAPVLFHGIANSVYGIAAFMVM